MKAIIPIGDNIAFLNLMMIGDKIAVEVGWIYEPTEEQRARFDQALDLVLAEIFQQPVESLGSQVIHDPKERQAAIRKYLGGGQG